MNLKCVIVEDQTMFLQMLHNMLQAIPSLEVVATAQTQAAGLAAGEEHKPDVLVLDLALPDGNGVKVARRLAQLNPEVKILILSGEASTFICPSDLQDHVYAVLDKTQTFDELALEIKTLLPRARGGSCSPSGHGIREKLTEREYGIFELIGRGMMSKEIGEKLGISTLTVQTHRKRIADKLGTSGSELVQLATRNYHATLGARL